MMSETIEPRDGENKGISRRTVAKAMAWSVPLVAIAAPVPAFAASGSAPVVSQGPACKAPGGSLTCGGQVFKFGYGVPVIITNNDPSKNVYILGIRVVSQSPATPVFSPFIGAGLPLFIGAGGGQVEILLGGQSSNSSNIQNGSITLELTWGHSTDDTQHLDDPLFVTTTWSSTPPGCTCPGTA